MKIQTIYKIIKNGDVTNARFSIKNMSMTLAGIDICVKKWLDDCWIKQQHYK